MKQKLSTGYLMVGGTFLPATVAILATSLVMKQPTFKLTTPTIIAGLVGLVAGGFATSYFLKQNQSW